MEGGEEKDGGPITLLMTELKIWAKNLTERLQSGSRSNLFFEEPNNLNLIRTIYMGVNDDDDAALIKLVQSKLFDIVDHQYLAAILQAARFQPDFCKWISLMYRYPSAVAHLNRKQSLTIALS